MSTVWPLYKKRFLPIESKLSIHPISFFIYIVYSKCSQLLDFIHQMGEDEKVIVFVGKKIVWVNMHKNRFFRPIGFRTDSVKS